MKKGIFSRIVTLMLALCMLMGCVSAAAEEAKIADPSTMDQYGTYFTADSTEYAGLIWTDKSVFKTTSDLKKGIGGTLPTVDCSTHNGSHETIGLTKQWSGQQESENPNFLVALSASASNKSISGYEKRPTDTILVLDITGSMDSGSNERIKKLVPAVNHAIEELMKNNLNNRVGVVLYAQSKDRVIELLPLGRYAVGTGADKYRGQYIAVKTDGDFVWVGNTVRVEGGDLLNPDVDENGNNGEEKYKHQVEGATYIQGGLEKARQMFNRVTDVSGDIVINGEVHNTVRRIPALILVTDGNPTKATKTYADALGEDAKLVGDGSDGRSTMGMAFLCQLTAIFTKDEMGEHYNGLTGNEDITSVPDPVTPLFYTLGI